MKTTKQELLKMIEDIPNNAIIELKVRGNSTKDYSESSIIAFEDENGKLIIMDKLSF